MAAGYSIGGAFTRGLRQSAVMADDLQHQYDTGMVMPERHDPRKQTAVANQSEDKAMRSPIQTFI